MKGFRDKWKWAQEKAGSVTARIEGKMWKEREQWIDKDKAKQGNVLEKVAFRGLCGQIHGHRAEGRPRERLSQPWRSCKGDAHAVLKHATRGRNATPGGRSDGEGRLKDEAGRVGKECRVIRKTEVAGVWKNLQDW